MRNSLMGMALVLAATVAQGTNQDWDAYIAGQLKRFNAVTALKMIDTAPPSRDLTLLLVMARQHWDALSPATQALVKPWLLRPTDSDGDSVFDATIKYSSTPVTLQTTNFLIHYVTDDIAHAASPAFAQMVAAEMEVVYAREHTDLRFRPVPSDGTAGGDGRFDVYLADVGGLGIYGYAAAESSGSSYLVLDNDYDSDQYGYAEPVEPLRVTAAHEYFHAIQFAYDVREDPAFMEQSSTWMEDMVYPAIHDNWQYLGEPYTDINGNGQFDAGVDHFTDLNDRNGNGQRDEGSLDYPELPLDGFSTQLSFLQYGRFLWPRYLSERYGADIMVAAWENCAAQAGPNAFAAVHQALSAKGVSGASAYQEYALWGYDTTKYEDGANYPRVWVDGTRTTTADFASQTTPSLIGYTAPQMHLSTVYEQVVAPQGIYTFASIRGEPAVTMIVDSGSGALSYEPVVLEGGVGAWTAPTGAVKAVAVISNVSPSADCMTWVFRSGGASVADVNAVECPVAASSTPDDGGGGGGGAGDLALLALGLAALARRRAGV